MIKSTILKGIKWGGVDAPSPVTIRVDKNGFFIYWVCQNADWGLLDISTIRDTRTGKYARIPNSAKLRTTINMGGASDALEDKQIQIFYGPEFNNLKELNFSCMSADMARLWTDDLLKLAYDISAHNACPLTFLKKAHTKLSFMVERGDKLKVEKLGKLFTSKELRRIERALELTGLPSSYDDDILFDDFTYEKFLQFYQHLVGRHEVEKIFTELFPDATLIRDPQNAQNTWKSIDVDMFVNFLNKSQRDPRLNEILYKHIDKVRALEIMASCEPHKEVRQRECLSCDGFLRYLMSDDNAIMAPDKLELHMDMNQPLNHYFINSSHNTYLTGHQLRGKSSVDMYRQALLAGCRCVELDCWNGKQDEEPIITHGYTVVTEIPFKQVLEAINESAFKTSPYPVILSFENHCSTKQQAKMAQYCKEIFSPDVLLTEPLADYPLNLNTPLPSPERLKRKILIKILISTPPSSEAEPAIEMSDLVVYVQPVRFKSFDESERRGRWYEVTSFVETSATNLLKERPIDFVTFNKRQLTRVYPRGTRVDSSNYVPQLFWNAGCQMVALNYQTFDLGMQLNMGLFDYNGGAGYLLKPEFMRRLDKEFDPFVDSTVDGIIADTLSVQIISGQFLSEKRVGVYIEVEMYGLPVDSCRRKRTKVCPHNGINPNWQDEVFRFLKVILPDLASLRIAAYEESGKFIGSRLLPVKGLRPGYRHIPLRSEANQPLMLPTLFVKVDVNSYVPDPLLELADALENPIAHQSMIEKREFALSKLTEQLSLGDEPSEEECAYYR